MRLKIFHILFLLFFITLIPLRLYANINTREYNESLLDSAYKERSNKNYTKALQYLIEAKKLAENNNWKDLQISILNAIGHIYSDVLEYNKAMEYYMKGLNIALMEVNKEGELLLLNNIGVLYSSEKNYAKSQEYIKNAYQIANQLQDTLKMGRLATNLAVIAHKINDYDLAQEYINIGFKILKDHPQKIEFLFNRIAKVENLALKKNYDTAEILALEVLQQKEMISNNDLKNQFYVILSNIYSQKKDHEKAIFYAHEVLNNNAKLTDRIEAYQELSKNYQHKGQFMLSTQYKDSVIIFKDSLYQINEKNKAVNDQIRFDLIDLENKLSVNEQKQKSERLVFVLIISFLVVLFFILIWVFRIQSIRNKQRKIMSENKQRIIELELKEEKNEKLILEQQLKEQETMALLKQERLDNEKKEKLLLKRQLREQEALSLLEKERLTNEIDTKNRQLAARVLFQSNRNELIEDIIKKIPDILPSQWKNNELETVIQKLRIQLKDVTEWDGFLVYFEQINPGFLSTLKKKHSNLTAIEVRFLSYIYIGLDPKEIANLLNITSTYYRKKKQRIAVKLNIQTTELYNYLISFMDKKSLNT